MGSLHLNSAFCEGVSVLKYRTRHRKVPVSVRKFQRLIHRFDDKLRDLQKLLATA